MDTDPGLALNLMLRGGAIALLALIAGTLLREHARAMAARLGAAFALGTAASALASTPGFGDGFAWWHLPLVALNAGNMAVFWLFTRSLLDDAFVVRPWHAAAWAALAALGVAACLRWLPWAGTATTIATIALAALSVAQSIGAWREDLVEGRRRARWVIVGSAAAYAALLAVAALMPGADPRATFSGAGNAFGLAALSALAAWQLMRLKADDLLPPAAKRAIAVTPQGARVPALATPSTVVAAPPEATREAEPEADPRLVAALDRLMAIEQVYREPNLSIGALAARLALPEHKLRRLINQGLGYRNFSAFLNGYRLAQTKAALADPARADTPILELAMEAGFQSLGPFNRAFKESNGCTPSEYRRLRQRPAPAPDGAARLAETESG